jgi:hypothetical protein
VTYQEDIWNVIFAVRLWMMRGLWEEWNARNVGLYPCAKDAPKYTKVNVVMKYIHVVLQIIVWANGSLWVTYL